jgi:hypothetical protein
MSVKEKLSAALERIRNPQRDENEKEFLQQLGFKRLLFFVPFLIAALIFFLLSLK